ncbi:hypothetical protein D3C80_1705270 [compost metagenome]
MMNFANPSTLNANEIQAVLQNEETIFQKGQLGSFVQGMFGSGSSSSGGDGTLKIQVEIVGNASGLDDTVVAQAISDGVSRGMVALSKEKRRGSLLTTGVSYN